MVEVNPLPAQSVPGNVEAERMDKAVPDIFTVSKAELLKREAAWKTTKAGLVPQKKT